MSNSNTPLHSTIWQRCHLANLNLRGRNALPGLLLMACALLMTGCDDDDSDAPPPDDPRDTQATTSGGLATINTGDAVLGFIPVGDGLVVIELERLAPSAASSTGTRMIEDAAPIKTSFVLDSCGADSRAQIVACVGYDSSMLAMIDVGGFLIDGSVPTVIEVDTGAEGIGSFSGGRCVNCGVLIDAPAKQAIVSSSDGYRVFDYAGVPLAEYLSDPEAVPPRDLATENFSFDPSRRLIISPEYETADQNLWLINVDTQQIYRWNRRMVPDSLDEIDGLASLSEAGITSAMVADSAAVDPLTGIVTIGDEYTQGLLMLNLHNASFDDAAGTFSALDSATVLDYPDATYLTTGQAIEPTSHLLFLEEEFGRSMGVAQLPTTASLNAPVVSRWIGTPIPAPDDNGCPGVSSWTNVGDPHGLAIFTSNSTGKNPKGLLIDDNKRCAAVVDLQALLDAPLDPSFDGVPVIDPATDLVQEGIVTFVEIPRL